jgi:dienelactone hydrolase
MKKLLPIALLVSITSFGQNPLCDGSRFLNENFEIDSTMSVVYGNSTSFGGVNADLLMDIYEPAGDPAELRPVIILAHGGSFILGSRSDMHWQCREFARRGYVAATMSYRLYDGPLFPLPGATEMTEEVILAVSDAKAAIRYFREDADTDNIYRIDPNMVIVGGISAGAIIMDHVAYLDPSDNPEDLVLDPINANGGWAGNSSDNTSYSNDVQALLSYSGALRDADYIQAGDAPIFSAHDDQDNVVPYSAGSASIFSIPIIELEGSSLMHDKADEEGIFNQLITIENSTGHVSYFGNPEQTNEVMDASYQFLFDILCGLSVGVDEIAQTVELLPYPNPSGGIVNLDIPSDFQNGTIRVFNSLGAIVFEENLRSQNFYNADFSQYASGMYSLEIVNQNFTSRGFSKIIIE